MIFRLRHGTANSPPCPAESDSLSYGLPFRFQLLSTPFHNDAVTFSYDVMAYADRDFHPVVKLPLWAHTCTLLSCPCRGAHFPSLAEGVAVPHTLYDTERNKAYVNIGTSRDTSEFSCDSIRHWWYTYGSLYYPLARTRILNIGAKKGI